MREKSAKSDFFIFVFSHPDRL